MIDEADKAPLDVVAVLKSLIEDGEMRLADGRRIVSGDGGENENEIVIHKNFKVIVLANRPGYPFLGNDFFGSIGDIFSSHVITNPPLESEIELLTNYAPNVKKKMIIKVSEGGREGVSEGGREEGREHGLEIMSCCGFPFLTARLHSSPSRSRSCAS